MAEAQLGVSLVAAEFKRWQWLFRDQPVEDYGIDSQVEPRDGGYATGRLIGLQIKTGRAKYFKTKAPGGAGWFYSPEAVKTKRGQAPDKHLRYWLEHDLPVVVIIVDEVTEKIYWEHVTFERVQFTGASWKILVPASQLLDASAQAAFLELAQRPRPVEHDVLLTATRQLPPQAARTLHGLRGSDHFKALQLAARLSRGRLEPDVTAARLLGKDVRYLAGADGRLSAAVGEYAAEHGYPLVAAHAFTHAALQAPAGAGRFHALAAWNLILAGKRAEAGARLEAAEAAGAPALMCAWFRAINEHDGPGFPALPSESMQSSAAQIDTEPMYGIFLASHADADGDISAAIRHLESALSAAPDSSALRVSLARMLLSRVASDLSPLPTVDLDRVLALCTAAREQRLSWDGPSQEPLVGLLHAHLLTSDLQTVIRLAAQRPAGEATCREASGGLVAFLGLKAAVAEEDVDAAALIAQTASDDPRYTPAIELMTGYSEPEEIVEGWKRVLETTDDLDVVVYAITKVANAGTWPIPQLESHRELGLITAAGYEMIRARSEAGRGDLQAAKRRLRPFLAANAIGSEILIEILEEAGELEEALAECTKALTRFKSVPLAAKQWSLMVRLGQTGQAVTRAEQLLGGPALPVRLRRMLRDFLIEIAWTKEDWQAAEEQCQVALQEEPGRPRTQWALIGSAYNQRKWPEAWALLQEMNPDVTTPNQAGLWIGLHCYRGFDDADIIQVLDLIEHWPDEHGLHDQIVTGILTCGNKLNPDGKPVIPHLVPAQLERFHAALAAHLDRGTGTLRRFEGTPTDLVAAATADLAARASMDTLLEECLRSGMLPLSAICLILRRSYPASLLERAHGPIVAVAMRIADFDSETRDARAALDKAVLIETSALAVASELTELWPELRSAFSDVLVDPDVKFECLTACAQLRQAPGTVASLTFNDQRQTLGHSEASADELGVVLARANALEALLRGLDSWEVPPASAAERDDGRPWMGLVHDCMERGLTLWSDDVGLRADARALGCAAFGTVALLHVLTESERYAGDLRRVVVQLVRAGVADFVLDGEELAEVASGWNGYPGPATAVLQRPFFWNSLPDGLATFLAALDSAGAPHRGTVTAWVVAACRGIALCTAAPQLSDVLREFATAVANHLNCDDEQRAALLQGAARAVEIERTRLGSVTTALAALQTETQT